MITPQQKRDHDAAIGLTDAEQKWAGAKEKVMSEPVCNIAEINRRIDQCLDEYRSCTRHIARFLASIPEVDYVAEQLYLLTYKLDTQRKRLEDIASTAVKAAGPQGQ